MEKYEEQDLPTANSGRAIQDMVIEDIEKRKAVGAVTTPELFPEPPRPPLRRSRKALAMKPQGAWRPYGVQSPVMCDECVLVLHEGGVDSGSRIARAKVVWATLDGDWRLCYPHARAWKADLKEGP